VRVCARAVAIGVLTVGLAAGTSASPAGASHLPVFRGSGTATFGAGFIQLGSDGVVTFPGGGTGTYKFSYRTTFVEASPGTFFLSDATGTASGRLRAVQRNTGLDGPIRYVLKVDKTTGTIALVLGQKIVAEGRVDFSPRDPFRWFELGTLRILPVAVPA
jgi:hypothetical protein